jgi:M6 family metalloprotease-like protein
MVLAALGLAALVMPQRPRAQTMGGIYLEPIARSSVVRAPPEASAMLSTGAPALGIPSARAFFSLQPDERLRREGDFPLLIIPALFADSREPPVSRSQLQQLLFDGPAERGTLPDYYRDVSRNKLRVRGTVAPWVRTSVTLRDAAGEREGHGWIGTSMRAYVAEAIRLADASIDFRQFDNNGPDGVPNSGDDDGWVDGVAVKYAEVSGSCGGPGPWPHFGAARDMSGRAVETNERTPGGTPIRVQVYIADSAMDCTGTMPDGFAVLAHEFGHLIGLPDLYRAVDGTEREQRAWAVGCFDLMAAGTWGCGTGPKVPRFGPTHFSPFMKWRLGWQDFIDVEFADRQEFVLYPSQTSANALRVRLSPNSLEWFIFEYRPRSGFDLSLPAGGVLVYHYDAFEDERPVPEGQAPAFWYHLVEADGDNALRRSEVRGGNRGVASDVFVQNGAIASLDDASTPSTRDHLAGSSTLTIHSIRVDGAVARVTLSVGLGLHAAERDFPPAPLVLLPLDGRVRFTGGTAPFFATMVAGRLPEGVTATMQADALRIAGEPLAAGTFAASFLIDDASGRRISEAIRLEVLDIDFATPNLIRALAPSGAPLDPRIRAYLDRSGNADRGYDVGDLRAYLLRTGRLR